jgi:hypothetical protein
MEEVVPTGTLSPTIVVIHNGQCHHFLLSRIKCVDTNVRRRLTLDDVDQNRTLDQFEFIEIPSNQRELVLVFVEGNNILLFGASPCSIERKLSHNKL